MQKKIKRKFFLSFKIPTMKTILPSFTTILYQSFVLQIIENIYPLGTNFALIHSQVL